jgi:high-affinity iron transporter
MQSFRARRQTRKVAMLQAFIITLREGVEASLIVGIVFAYLTKIGRNDLKRTVFQALGSAIVASVLVAILVSHFQFNSDIVEGWVMLAAAGFVASMIWFMNKTARSIKGEIEARIAKVTGGTSRLGLFFFVFLLVLREGVETVLILSAVSLNSTELLSFTGTMLGIAVAVVFGVMFIRGSVKINLQRFFRVTSVILYFVTFQLLVSGLHELSENGVLPSSTAEMRYIGPIVRNDLFFFVTMLALAALMILMEQRRRSPITPETETSPAQRRKAEWSQRREKLWMTAVVSASFLFIFLSTAEFIYAKSSTELSATSPVTLVGDQVTVPASQIADDQLHRFGVHVDDGNGHSAEVRFLLFKKPDGNIVSVADACQICGPVGFYIGSQGIVCKMCASPLNAASMGQPGGCNPIPLKSTLANGQVVIAAADLRAIAPKFEK